MPSSASPRSTSPSSRPWARPSPWPGSSAAPAPSATLYEGTLLSAEEARAAGLVDFVVPTERLRSETQAYAAALARKPAEALAAIRRCITAGVEVRFDDGLRLELEAAVHLAGTAAVSLSLEGEGQGEGAIIVVYPRSLINAREGRMVAGRGNAAGGKSGLQRAGCWVTPRGGNPTDQCHRKQTAVARR